MATTNQLRVNLGHPDAKLNPHKCLYVHQGDEEEALKMEFYRTIRVPEDGTVYNLPPGLDTFPLYNVAHYKKTLPEAMMLKGGCFLPVHRHEALWISFKSIRPFAVKVYLGGINAISGEPLMETFATTLGRSRLVHEKSSIQDYAVVDPDNTGQLWLDGIAKQNGAVMQFVAVPFGSRYSVETQVTDTEAVGGIQIFVTPIKRGPTQFIYVSQLSKGPLLVMVHSNASVYEFMCEISKMNKVPVDQMGLLYNSRRLEKNHLLSYYGIPDRSTVNLILNIQGGGIVNGASPGGEMSVGAGGLIKQSILRDHHAAIVWDGENTAMFNIQLLNATDFRRVTGTNAPPSPITASHYASAGLPFFSLIKEVNSGIKDVFSDIQSVKAIDIKKGVLIPKAAKGKGKVRVKGKTLVKELEFPTVQLDKRGMHPKFVGVFEMEKKLMDWGSAQFS